MLETLVIMVVKIGVVFGVLLLVAAYMTWIERKVIAAIHWEALRLWIKRVPVSTHPRKLRPPA